MMPDDPEKPFSILGLAVLEWLVILTLTLFLLAFVAQGLDCTLTGQGFGFCLP